MCIPAKNDQSDSAAPGHRSVVSLGALMLVACLAGPALAGAIGALGIAGLALALCASVPAIALVRRPGRRFRRALTKLEVLGVRPDDLDAAGGEPVQVPVEVGRRVLR